MPADLPLERSLAAPIRDLATDRFLLLSGPRQVGKTTLAQAWLHDVGGGEYLNWDVPEHRERILGRSFLEGLPPAALVLDELHKYPRWKAWLKGLYDRPGPRPRVVVTGSARLDLHQRGGDSLVGRHERLRLHPFSVGELTHGTPAGPPEDWLSLRADVDPALWDRLETRGGFPEPWLSEDEQRRRRWAAQRRSVIIREDLRDLTHIRQVGLVEHLALLLPDRVGSPLSVNALREELAVGHDTVSNWLDALETLYVAYRLPPYTKRLARALKKERKLYLWDWSQVSSPAARFENTVASHLLKAVHLWSDLGQGEFALHYVRDREKREVDFVVTNGRAPVVLIEAKVSETEPSASLIHFQDRLGAVPAVQLVRTPGVDRASSLARRRVVTAATFLGGLP